MNREKTRERLAMLSSLEENHGGEGEPAPNKTSFEAAQRFIDQHEFNGAAPASTFGESGNAVLEFHGEHMFGSIEFFPNGLIEVYVSEGDGHSEIVAGENPLATVRLMRGLEIEEVQ